MTSKSNTDHIVFLIGEKVTASVERTRIEHPNLDIKAAHSDLACLHCGRYFPMSKCLPLDVEMVGVIAKEFRRQHMSCKEGKKSKGES